jgi:uncharacterized membrane protein YebE (DUF533 family)
LLIYLGLFLLLFHNRFLFSIYEHIIIFGYYLLNKENLMFDAQSLLGGLLKGTLSGGKMGNKAALGMGALGIAIAAYEHFTQDQNNTRHAASSANIPPPIQSAQGLKTAAPPPPPVPPMSAVTSSAPPKVPPPMSSNAVEMAPAEEKPQAMALLLIDAMLAAANADGYIDPDEEAKILQQLTAVNSDQDGFDYVQQRIDAPPTLEQICAQVNDTESAQQVYMVSLLAITVDTSEEQNYLTQLANCLKLPAETVTQLNEQFQTKE